MSCADAVLGLCKVESTAQELSKREEEVEALAAAVAQKDEEVARLAEELKSRHAIGGGAAPAGEGVNPENTGLEAHREELAEQQAAEVEQQKHTISQLQVVTIFCAAGCTFQLIVMHQRKILDLLFSHANVDQEPSLPIIRKRLIWGQWP